MTTVTGVDLRSALRLCHRSAEFRAVDDEHGDGRTLEGHAAVFNTPTTIESYAGDFEEEVVPGAFRKTLRERTPVMQFDHGNDKAVGTAPIAGIQDLHEDDEGLFVRSRLLDTPRVEDIRQAIQLRAIRGMSFKFRVIRDRWLDRDGNRVADDDLADLLDDPGDRGPVRRQITEVELFELGPVVFPAYTETSVGVRSFPDGTRFNPNALAVRGILSQFGLTERCVHRHLGAFDEREREVLAAEIDKTFPELRAILAAAVPDLSAADDDPPGEEDQQDPQDQQASSDVAHEGTSDTVPDAASSSRTSGESARPTVSHLAPKGSPQGALPDLPFERV